MPVALAQLQMIGLRANAFVCALAGKDRLLPIPAREPHQSPPPITLALGLAVRLPEVPVAAQVSPPHPIWPPQELDSWNTPFWGQVPAIQLS